MTATGSPGSTEPWAREADEVLEALGSSASSGLPPEVAAARSHAHPNELPTAPSPGLLRVALEQLRDTFVLLLVASCAVALAVGDVRDAVVIAAVIVVNTGLGVRQSAKAERALDSLRALTRTEAVVVRGGATLTLGASEVAEGDLLHLSAGQAVPADARLVVADELSCDESALTGESFPASKDTAALPAGTPVADRGNCVFAGTTVVTGSGLAVVVRTGAATEVGRLARSLHQAEPPPTPLQRQLDRLGKQVAAGAGAVCGVVVLMGLLRGEDWEVMLLTGVSLAVAAVPESLPAVVAVSLALAAQRMALRRAVVRSLPAIETLGAVTVVATDKTGTLTEGRLEVAEVWPSSSDTRVWRAAVLCNDAQEGQAGDPLELALLRRAAAAGIDAGTERARAPRVATEPFDPRTRRMTTAHEDGDGGLLVCKGAPEAVLLRSSDLERAADLAREADRLADQGLRVLALAESRDGGASWEPLGLVGFVDPLRASAARAVQECLGAGIAPVLVTGDHLGTAKAVAAAAGLPVAGARAGLPGPGQPVPSVLARVTPEEKLHVVELLQARGEVVAMTGDGVNDGPALRRADVGVAMGRSGTEVARRAADVVLLDDDLATLVAAVAEGRRVGDSIRRFLLYAMSGGVAELLVMLVGPLVGLALPLLPAQVLWVNLLTHGPPGVALGSGSPAPGLLDRPPRRPGAPLVDPGTWRRLVALGTLMALTSLGTALVVQQRHGPWQSSLFLVLAVQQLAVAVSLAWAGGRGARGVLAAVALSGCLLGLALTWPPLRQVLGLTRTPGLTALGVLPACAAAPALAGFWARRR